jgi:prepilin signal peptidase PulO-like enzyme (type II secretory pathway)
VLAYFKIGLTLSLPILLIALTLLLGLVLYDRTHHILPPVLLWPFVGFSAVFGALEASTIEALGMTALIALVFALFLALIHFASGGRAMGLADAPLVFGLSMLSGTTAFSGLMYSFWIGGVIGIALLALRAGGTTIKSEVPFAPFLAAGFLLAYFSSWDVLLLADLLTPVI